MKIEKVRIILQIIDAPDEVVKYCYTGDGEDPSYEIMYYSIYGELPPVGFNIQKVLYIHKNICNDQTKELNYNPNKWITEADKLFSKETRKIYEKDKCPICLEEMEYKVVDNDIVKTNNIELKLERCGHVYHTDCLI